MAGLVPLVIYLRGVVHRRTPDLLSPDFTKEELEQNLASPFV